MSLAIQITSNLMLFALGFLYVVFGANNASRISGYTMSIVAFLQALVNFGVIQ